MSIVPPAAHKAQHPPEILTERLARLDGCIDACGNSELPYRIENTDDGFVGFYGCEDCGQFWSTSWRD